MDTSGDKLVRLNTRRRGHSKRQRNLMRETESLVLAVPKIKMEVLVV